MNDRTAIIMLKEGNIGGLEHLVRTYQSQALRAAYLIVHNYAVAEDIVQSAFLRVYEHIDRFDLERAFAPWFLRIVTNIALNTIRRSKYPTHLDDDFPSCQDPPEAGIIAAETAEEVLNALQLLPPAQRMAIVQRYYLGWSEAEMSQSTGCAPGTIKWRIHAAKKHLRRVLGPLFRPSTTQPAVIDQTSTIGEFRG